jgi:signal transduction histidine kinase
VLRVAENEAQQGRAILENPKQRFDGAAGAEVDIEHEKQQPVIKLSPARRDPVVTTGDPALVELAVANALRNAIEAVMGLQEPNPSDVVLNWGITNTDSWIVVLDEGCGLPEGWDRLTEPGTTTKPKNEGHLGMGVPIAKRAIESMRGTFQLTPRSGVGVSCEIRWPYEGNTL